MSSSARATKRDRTRVLLVSTNRERQPYPVVPNGLACVASALDAAGHEVQFLDLCFARDATRAAYRCATSITATRSHFAITRQKRGTSFAPCANPRQKHRSSPVARRLES